MNILSKIQRAEKLSPNLRSLYLHKIIHDVGISLISMFGVIFLYVISNSINFVLFFYGTICLLYFLAAPLWAKLLKFYNLNVLMALGTLFYVFFFLGLYFLSQKGAVSFWMLAFLILINVLARLFYWVPYHIDFARFVNRHHRGRQLSFLSIIISLVGIALPVLSALIINKFGFSVLFLLSIAVVLISLFPLYFIPRTRESYSFGYFKSFKKLFSKSHFKSNIAYFADGFQDHIGSLIWPIFIFLILKGQYLEVGLVSSGIILVSCILRYGIGEATDRFDKKKLMRTSSILYAFGWALKTIVAAGWHIFLVGVYHDFTHIMMRTPLDVLTYEIAADEGHYVDEFTILREMSLNLGRSFSAFLCLALLNFVTLPMLFLLGIAMTLLVNLISKEEFFLSQKH